MHLDWSGYFQREYIKVHFVYEFDFVGNEDCSPPACLGLAFLCCAAVVVPRDECVI